MSVDQLQKKIRKCNNPSVVDMTVPPDLIPASVMEQEGSFLPACRVFSEALLRGLSEIVPAVRFSMAAYLLRGAEGVTLLQDLLKLSAELGYYVIVDVPEALSVAGAEQFANMLLEEQWQFDGAMLSCGIGSDALKPFLQMCKSKSKSVFVVVRTGNPSASEFQDLMTGTRLSHMAVADMAGRLGQPYMEKCGYSSVGMLVSAASLSGLKNVRSKNTATFLLLDGYDYPNCNAKNCSFAFDNFGHGAAACAGRSILGAWQDEDRQSDDYVAEAVRSADRMKRNLTRYVNIL